MSKSLKTVEFEEIRPLVQRLTESDLFGLPEFGEWLQQEMNSLLEDGNQDKLAIAIFGNMEHAVMAFMEYDPDHPLISEHLQAIRHSNRFAKGETK